MKRAAQNVQPIRARGRFSHLLIAMALLCGLVAAGAGCAVHAYARPIPVRLPIVAVRLSPPPPPVERCTTQRMCNIWGFCHTRVICAHY